MKYKYLVETAVYVVDSFDQANTNESVEKIGSRGVILKNAIEKLRKILNKDKQLTTLTGKEGSK